ncbi:M23 family metallopeptidase [Variovorax sp. J22R24]|uniref:M23 family metallopeptidase n=1 Tax=Variovorax gracilis TaxID=3053502 RepID=UPI0025767FA8|nr:M23 family metallopeptidase [Variovorax sp. J22R24]MDM0103567.1 M23 family metallopeptidase [Variovorax sp. J22R24]
MSKADRTFLRPAGGAVIARFDGRGNKGVDFAGSKGDPVRAARDGKVVYSAVGPRGYGQLVMIKHDSAYVTAYAHNSQLLVKEGQSVKRGQVIARMGDTEASRVKLHFELRKNGNAVDPALYLESADASASRERDQRDEQ